VKFHTVKTSSVVDRAETIQDLIAKKQRRADNNLGTSANEPQVVYAPIGRLVVKEIEEAPAPIRAGDVYKTRDGKSCRIIVADKKGVSPIIGLADDGDIEIPYTYTSRGTISSNSGHPADLVLPSTRRKIVEFSATAQWSPEDYPGF